MVKSGTGIEVMSYLGKLNKGRFIWAGNGSKSRSWARLGGSHLSTKWVPHRSPCTCWAGPLAGHVRVSRRVMNGWSPPCKRRGIGKPWCQWDMYGLLGTLTIKCCRFNEAGNGLSKMNKVMSASCGVCKQDPANKGVAWLTVLHLCENGCRSGFGIVFPAILLETTEFIVFWRILRAFSIKNAHPPFLGNCCFMVCISGLEKWMFPVFSNQGFKYCVSLTKLCLFRDLQKKNMCF